MEFKELITSIQEIDTTLSRRAASAVNVGLNARNWLVGAWIVEYEQKGSDRAEYGERLIEEIAANLNIKGLSIAGLRRCRTFFNMYPQIRATLSHEFPNMLFISELQIRATVSREFESLDEGKFQTASGISDSGTPSQPKDKRAVNEKLTLPKGQTDLFAPQPSKVATPSQQSQNNIEVNELEKGATLSHLFKSMEGRIIQTVSGLSKSAAPAQSEVPRTPPDMILTRLSFSQIVELLKLDDSLKRTFYEIEAIKGNWSVRELKRQIGRQRMKTPQKQCDEFGVRIPGSALDLRGNNAPTSLCYQRHLNAQSKAPPDRRTPKSTLAMEPVLPFPRIISEFSDAP